MYETVTVDEAIRKGHKTVTYPAVAIFFALLIGFTGLGIANLLPTPFLIVGIIAAFIIPWLFWSVRITAWKVWAFDNVRNVHELKRRAITEQLIWRDGSFLEKTSIRTRPQKEKWEELQAKFLHKDVFDDDLSVPGETIIGYSRNNNLAGAAFMLVVSVAGFYMVIAQKRVFFGYAAIVVGGWLAFDFYRKASNRTPQIILNAKGIETAKTPFYTWNQVRDEEVIRDGSGKNTHDYLSFNSPEGEIKLGIGDFDTNITRLNRLLVIYRGRYDKHQLAERTQTNQG